MNNFKECLSYDDVLLVPQFSEIEHRADISLTSELGKGIVLSLPIIASCMDTVCESNMSNAMLEMGGLGIIHRYNTIPKQIELYKESKNSGCAIGVSGDYLERAQELYNAGCRIMCVDVAHGDHTLMCNTIRNLTQKYSDIHIMAGNVATAKAFSRLSYWGANSIRVGIGNGSCCSTQIQTGFGVPSLSSIMDCYEAVNDNKAKIIADGGLKNSGDLVKSYAAGADFCMLGSMLAGTDETPGEIQYPDGLFGQKVKVYRGMASKESQIEFKGSFNSIEGISTTIPYKGSVKGILRELETGIRSGLSYNGSHDLTHLRENHEFIKRSSASILDSQPHILTRK